MNWSTFKKGRPQAENFWVFWSISLLFPLKMSNFPDFFPKCQQMPEMDLNASMKFSMPAAFRKCHISEIWQYRMPVGNTDTHARVVVGRSRHNKNTISVSGAFRGAIISLLLEAAFVDFVLLRSLDNACPGWRRRRGQCTTVVSVFQSFLIPTYLHPSRVSFVSLSLSEMFLLPPKEMDGRWRDICVLKGGGKIIGTKRERERIIPKSYIPMFTNVTVCVYTTHPRESALSFPSFPSFAELHKLANSCCALPAKRPPPPALSAQRGICVYRFRPPFLSLSLPEISSSSSIRSAPCCFSNTEEGGVKSGELGKKRVPWEWRRRCCCTQLWLLLQLPIMLLPRVVIETLKSQKQGERRGDGDVPRDDLIDNVWRKRGESAAETTTSAEESLSWKKERTAHHFKSCTWDVKKTFIAFDADAPSPRRLSYNVCVCVCLCVCDNDGSPSAPHNRIAAAAAGWGRERGDKDLILLTERERGKHSHMAGEQCDQKKWITCTSSM